MKIERLAIYVILVFLLLTIPLRIWAQAPTATRFVNGHFQNSDGSLFIPLGGFYGNVLPYIRNDRIVTEEDWRYTVKRSIQRVPEAELRQWLGILRDNGCNTLRIFSRLHAGSVPGHIAGQGDLLVNWNLDAAGHVNPQVWSVLDHYMKVAEEYGFHFIFIVFNEPAESIYSHWAPYTQAVTQYQQYGWVYNRFVPQNVGERRLLPTADDYLTNEEAVSLQKQYLTELLPLLRAHPSLLAVELANEQGWTGKFQWERQKDEIAWSQEMVRSIRTLAPGLPVCFSLSHGLTAMDPIRWSAAIEPDFYSSHPANGENGEQGRYDYAASIALINDYSATTRPCFPGESYLPKDMPVASRHLALRDNIWMSLTSNGPGYLQWPDVSQTIAELREYKAASQFTRDLSWLTKPLAEPPVTFNIRPLADFLGSADDHDKKKKSAQLATLIRYEMLSLDSGVPVGFCLTGPLPTEAEIESLRAKNGGVFGVPTGYQARYLLAASRRNGLIYLRNYPIAATSASKYREPVSRPFTLTTTLSKGKYRFEILDLDKQTSEKIVVQSPGVVLHRDQTSSDFAIKFQRID